MKENILDILTFLFDNYYIGDSKMPSSVSNFELEMCSLGFSKNQALAAVGWLHTLRYMRSKSSLSNVSSSLATRVYTEAEKQKICVKARALLQDLENKSILDVKTREIIVDMVLATGADSISYSDFLRVIGIIVYNQSSFPREILMAMELVDNNDILPN